MKFIVKLMLFVFMSVGLSANKGPMDYNSLSEYQWKNRILLIYSEADSQDVSKQVKLFNADVAKNLDRNLLLFKTSSKKGLEKVIKDNKFLVMLIGKDGGVKDIFSKPVEMSEIYNQIDSMPMRAQEMRDKN